MDSPEIISEKSGRFRGGRLYSQSVNRPLGVKISILTIPWFSQNVCEQMACRNDTMLCV